MEIPVVRGRIYYANAGCENERCFEARRPRRSQTLAGPAQPLYGMVAMVSHPDNGRD